MNPARVLGWLLFTFWAVWLVAIQAWLCAGSDGARWMPDLGLILSLSLLARMEARDLLTLALVSTLARVTFSIEPSVAILAGMLGVLGLALAARSIVELSGPAWRALIGGVLVLLFDGWLVFVHQLRAGELALDLELNWMLGWRAALSSSVLALLCGPLLVHLPGLTPLRRRRW